MDATESVNRLRELVSRCDDLGALGEFLAPRLRHYLEHAHEGVTLDQALGVAAARGKLPWWRVATLKERDNAIRELAKQYFGSLDLNSQADEILQAIRRYRAGRWRHDYRKERMPATYIGTPTEPLYTALRKGDGDVPESKRHLRRILEDTK